MTALSLPAPSRDLAQARKQIAAWLACIAVLLLAMIMLGGLTRLTQSGLSITEWHPVTGVIPPLSAEDWAQEFAKYQRIPEYRLVNAGMTLAGFKTIYWWEWSHRLLGRLIGFVFLVPLLYFIATGRIERARIPRLVLLFLLGGAQGALGWFMVKSGLSVRTDVSQYRLAAHLVTGFAIYGAVLWTLFDLVRPLSAYTPGAGPLRGRALVFIALLSLQIVMGAFVAGLDAGWSYNTWPLMDGGLFPPNPGVLLPWYAHLFDNRGVVQFLHRMLAYLVLGMAFWLWLDAKKRFGDGAPAARSAGLLLGFVAAQVMLGILTLLAVVPLPLAAAHQLTAALLFGAALYHAHGLWAASADPGVFAPSA
jgi:heme a synthase